MTINKMGTGIAHSKLILIGEHSVVYGQPAIALPVTILKTTVTITSSKYFTSSFYYVHMSHCKRIKTAWKNRLCHILSLLSVNM